MLRHVGYVVLGVLVVLSIGQCVAFYGQLPEKVASQFGIGGQPNGYMSRDSYLFLNVMLQVVLPLAMLGIGRALPLMPNELINVPRREYWLNQENRSYTINVMQGMLIWLAIFTSAFMLGIFHLAFRANVDKANLDERTFLILLGAFLVAVFGLTFGTMWRFMKPIRTVAT
jgi:uncharacterized membrane protein